MRLNKRALLDACLQRGSRQFLRLNRHTGSRAQTTLVRPIADLAMGPRGACWQSTDSPISGKPPRLSIKPKRRQRREPSKPFGRIRRECEQALFGTDHDVLALCPIFNQWQHMRLEARINGCRRESWLLLQGVVRRRVQGLYHLNCWGREKSLMCLKPCCSNREGMLRGKEEAKPGQHS